MNYLNENLKPSIIRRIIAFFIDYTIVCAIAAFLAILLIGFDNIGSIDNGSIDKYLIFIMIPPFLIYFFRESYKGVSLGKWVAGIKVIDEKNNQRPSYLKLLLRNIFLFIFPLEFLILLVNKKGKRLGDLIAGTLVVTDQKKSLKKYRIGTVVILIALFYGISLPLGSSKMKKTEAFIVASDSISENSEIIEKTGEVIGFGMITQGNINITNGYGYARFRVKVVGKNNNTRVTVTLRKEPDGEWKTEKIN